MNSTITETNDDSNLQPNSQKTINRKRRLKEKKKRNLKKKPKFNLIESNDEVDKLCYKIYLPYGGKIIQTRGYYRAIRMMAKKRWASQIKKGMLRASIDSNLLPHILRNKNYVGRISLIYFDEAQKENLWQDKRSLSGMTFHIASGELLIQWKDQGDWKTSIVRQRHSLEIKEEIAKKELIEIKVSGTPALLMVEDGSIVENKRSWSKSILQKVINQKKHKQLIPCNTQVYVLNIVSITAPSSYQYSPPISKQPISYIRNIMNIDEIRQRILFLDCEFVSGEFEVINGKRKGTTLLASLCITNYYGVIILDTKVTPSKNIRMYHTRITGFRPGDLTNQRKENEIITEVGHLVKGRILVGHDLTSDLRVLKINKNTLSGIRDLSTSVTLRNLTGCENPRMRLQKLTEQLLNRELYLKESANRQTSNEYHSAFVDVKAIRDIYLNVESKWIDNCGLGNI